MVVVRVSFIAKRPVGAVATVVGLDLLVTDKVSESVFAVAKNLTETVPEVVVSDFTIVAVPASAVIVNESATIAA
jgi:hypothetical protein